MCKIIGPLLKTMLTKKERPNETERENRLLIQITELFTQLDLFTQGNKRFNLHELRVFEETKTNRKIFPKFPEAL